MDDQALTVIEMSGLSVARNPEMVLKEADMVARPWGLRVEKLQLYKMIGPSKHLYIEAWQMLAMMYRVTARVKETRFVEFGEVRGYEATAEAFHMPSGQLISSADAMCLSDEDNWGPRPKYEWRKGDNGRNEKVRIGDVHTPLQQLRSMAQTRACSKVLANLFKWVARMQGFAGTPAEEMSGEETPHFDSEGNQQQQQQPQRKQQPQQPSGGGNGNGAQVISEKQASRIWGIGHGADKSKDQVIAILKHYGFDTAKDVTPDKYEAICAEVGRSDAA